MLINIFGQRAVLRYLNLEHCCSLQRQFFLNKPRLHTGTCADNAAKLDNSYCQKHEQLPIKIKNHGTLKISLVLELEHPALPFNWTKIRLVTACACCEFIKIIYWNCYYCLLILIIDDEAIKNNDVGELSSIIGREPPIFHQFSNCCFYQKIYYYNSPSLSIWFRRSKKQYQMPFFSKNASFAFSFKMSWEINVRKFLTNFEDWVSISKFGSVFALSLFCLREVN